MLTKSDVKVIGDLFDKKFDEGFDRKFDASFDRKFDEKIKPISDDLKTIKKDVGVIKKDVKKLQKDVSGVIDMSDKGLLKVQKRVITIEKHLGFPEADFA